MVRKEGVSVYKTEDRFWPATCFGVSEIRVFLFDSTAVNVVKHILKTTKNRLEKGFLINNLLQISRINVTNNLIVDNVL